MKFKDVKAIASKTVNDFMEDKVMQLSAATAYYAVFSLGPLLLIATAVVALLWQDRANQAQEEVVSEVEEAVNPEVAGMLETMLQDAAASPESGIVATIISIVLLIYVATTLFSQIQDSLNTIWGVQPKVGGIMGIVRVRIMSLGVILATGLLFLSLTVASAVVAGFTDALAEVAPWLPTLTRILNLVVAVALLTVLIAAIFRVLPDAKVAWQDVWAGAAFTAVLLTLGTWGIGWYLGATAPGSAYGAAGSLVALLIWIYYSSLIFFVGAEFTHAYMEHFSGKPEPEEHAELVEEEAG